MKDLQGSVRLLGLVRRMSRVAFSSSGGATAQIAATSRLDEAWPYLKIKNYFINRIFEGKTLNAAPRDDGIVAILYRFRLKKSQNRHIGLSLSPCHCI